MTWHPNQIASIVLSGGEGRRLFPLTQHRSKPALPFGEHRIIDIPISHSLNAGVRKIFVLTQFLSSSLHRHLIETYRLDPFSQGFIEILAPEQRPGHASWYLGTADAVRQNMDYLRRCDAEYFLILSGDQIYTFDLTQLLQQAVQSGADLTIAAIPIGSQDASRMGILEVNEDSFVEGFFEKPKTAAQLARLNANQHLLKSKGFKARKDSTYLGSMGIYVFKRKALFDLLQDDVREDFGKHLIPTMVSKGNVSAYLHHGYWEDIGTVGALHKANMALVDKDGPLQGWGVDSLFYKRPVFLPAPKIYAGRIEQSVICAGAVIDAQRVTRSVIGARTFVQKGASIEETVVLGNEDSGFTSIGPKSVIRHAIIDKNVQLGAGVQLINHKGLQQLDAEPIFIRDGVIVVTEGARLPEGFVL